MTAALSLQLKVTISGQQKSRVCYIYLVINLFREEIVGSNSSSNCYLLSLLIKEAASLSPGCVWAHQYEQENPREYLCS